jgi:hypothetical protein
LPKVKNEFDQVVSNLGRVTTSEEKWQDTLELDEKEGLCKGFGAGVRTRIRILYDGGLELLRAKQAINCV